MQELVRSIHIVSLFPHGKVPFSYQALQGGFIKEKGIGYSRYERFQSMMYDKKAAI